MTIDLNCDLGESFGPWEMGNDAAMIELATSVNIACGYHAGDADIMRKTVELAKAERRFNELVGKGFIAAELIPGGNQRKLREFDPNVDSKVPADVQALVASLGVKSSSAAVLTAKLSSGVELISKPSHLNVPPWQMISAILGGIPLRTATWWANPRS